MASADQAFRIDDRDPQIRYSFYNDWNATFINDPAIFNATVTVTTQVGANFAFTFTGECDVSHSLCTADGRSLFVSQVFKLLYTGRWGATNRLLLYSSSQLIMDIPSSTTRRCLSTGPQTHSYSSSLMFYHLRGTRLSQRSKEQAISSLSYSIISLFSLWEQVQSRRRRLP